MAACGRDRRARVSRVLFGPRPGGPEPGRGVQARGPAPADGAPGTAHVAAEEITLPVVEITVRLREDAEVEAVLGACALDVITHEVGPGFTAPGIGTVEYGYWDLKVATSEP